MSSEAEKVSSATKPGFSNYTHLATVKMTFPEYVEGFAEHTERNVVDSCIYCGRSAHCYLAQITAELSVIGHFECEDGHQYSKMVTSSELYEDYKVYGGSKLVEKRKMKKGGRV